MMIDLKGIEWNGMACSVCFYIMLLCLIINVNMNVNVNVLLNGMDGK
jgi:hypothetical protein